MRSLLKDAARKKLTSEFESAVATVGEFLESEGFTRSEGLFHRRVAVDQLNAKVEGISLRFEHGFRTCWLHATAKFPALIDLLSEVRPFAYRKELAWRAPDYASHVCCMLNLADLGAPDSLLLPLGLRWTEEGRLRRARSVPAPILGAVLLDVVRHFALPALRQRLTLRSIAAVTEAPAYSQSGLAGAWPLAARIALGDNAGAARAFQIHPASLGADERRFQAAKAWLIDKGVDVAALRFAATQDHSQPMEMPPCLSGFLLSR